MLPEYTTRELARLRRVDALREGEQARLARRVRSLSGTAHQGTTLGVRRPSLTGRTPSLTMRAMLAMRISRKQPAEAPPEAAT